MPLWRLSSHFAYDQWIIQGTQSGKNVATIFQRQEEQRRLLSGNTKLWTSFATEKESSYYYTMRRYLRNEILCILIASYAYAAAIGPFEILRHVLNSGAHSLQLSSAKKSRPIDDRPIWTQRKHIPTPTKVEVPQETILSSIEFPEDRSFVSIDAGRPSIPAVNLSQLPSKPRDPPSA